MSARVELRVQAVRFGGWTSVEVTRSIETACSTFSLEAIRQSSEPTVPIPKDADCEILIDGQKVLSGVVGKLTSTRSGDSSRLSVSGRSKTREIVDCSADHPGRWVSRTVAQIATELCQPYGITVVDEARDATPIGRFALQSPEETVYSAVERAARVRSLLLTDDAEGRLVLTRAGSTRGGTIERGKNILSSTVTADSEGLFSEIRCKGSRVGDDTDFGESVFSDASASDDGPRHRRVLVVSAEGRADQAACLARARWEIASRYGKSITLTYEVPGWTQDSGALWQPNTLVRVIDPEEYVDGTFLLVSVSYRLSGSEFRSSLELAPVEGFVPLVLPTLKTRGKKRDGKLLGIRDPETIGVTVRQAHDVRGSSGRSAP